MPSSFASGQISQLFATPVWTFVPAAGAALAESLAQYLEALRAVDPARAASDAVGYWQSRDNLYEAPEFARLVSLIDEASRAVRASLQVDCQLQLTGMWGNISRGAGALHEHTHPNNYLSGVFYARMPEGAGPIVFKDPRPQTRILRPRALADNPLNSLELEYAAAPGSLLLFPAWLEHSVRPSRGEGERMTIAWNQMVRGPLGSRQLLAYSEL